MLAKLLATIVAIFAFVFPAYAGNVNPDITEAASKDPRISAVMVNPARTQAIMQVVPDWKFNSIELFALCNYLSAKSILDIYQEKEGTNQRVAQLRCGFDSDGPPDFK